MILWLIYMNDLEDYIKFPLDQGLKDPKEKTVANAIAEQNAMPRNKGGNSPVIDYIVKKQADANKSPKAKGTHEHYTPKGKHVSGKETPAGQ